MEIKERKENNMAVPSSCIPTVKKKKLLTFVFPELEIRDGAFYFDFFVERSS